MNESYLMINGKRIDLTPEQLATLGIEAPKKSPFERITSADEMYFYINCLGGVGQNRDYDCEEDNKLYDAANYCTDKALLKQRALHEALNRRLWRYSMENGGDKIDWNAAVYKYAIYFCHIRQIFSVMDGTMTFQLPGVVYFDTSDIASAAIKEVVEPFITENPEFQW